MGRMWLLHILSSIRTSKDQWTFRLDEDFICSCTVISDVTQWPPLTNCCHPMNLSLDPPLDAAQSWASGGAAEAGGRS